MNRSVGRWWLATAIGAALLALIVYPTRRETYNYTVNPLGIESMTGAYVQWDKEWIEKEKKILDEARGKGGIQVKEVVVKFGKDDELELSFEEFEKRIRGECK